MVLGAEGQNPDPASPAIMMSGQGPAYASNIQSLQGFARCNLQANLPARGGRRLARYLGVLLGTGFGNVAWAHCSSKFDGQYMGELALTKEISGDCTQPPPGALYPLTVSRGEVRYAYVPRFDTTLSGKVDENGVFKASARLRKGFVQMTGRIQGSNLTAHIVSPSCNYAFQTKK